MPFSWSGWSEASNRSQLLNMIVGSKRMLESSLYVASQAQRLATTNTRLPSANWFFECDKDVNTMLEIHCAS
jgi:hypothetical protein